MLIFLATSRLALRRCKGWRFASSEAREDIRKTTHVPISTDFGGITIHPSLRVRNANTPLQRPLRVDEFRKGSFAQQLAQSQVQKERTREDVTNSASVSKEHDQGSFQKRTQDGGSRMEQSFSGREHMELHGGGVERQRRPEGVQRARRRTDLDRREPRPDEDIMQARRRVRPERRSASNSPRGSKQGEDIKLELVHKYPFLVPSQVTKVQYRRRDDPPVKHVAPSPRPALTNLGVYIGRHIKGQHELQGGDYTRHLSQEGLESVRMQARSSLGVLDRARLALSLNQTLRVKEKRAGIERVRHHVGKTSTQ